MMNKLRCLVESKNHRILLMTEMVARTIKAELLELLRSTKRRYCHPSGTFEECSLFIVRGTLQSPCTSIFQFVSWIIGEIGEISERIAEAFTIEVSSR